MNLIFMRHGEATDNVKGVFSDKEIYWSVLTEFGVNTVKKSVETLPQKIDKIYYSPLPRTIQTAHLAFERHIEAVAVVDDRLREVDYGNYSGRHNGFNLDEVRKKQVAGDYDVRFGETGENRCEIELRLSSFFADVAKDNAKDDTILIVSHGTVISFMKRILGLPKSRLEPGMIEEYHNVVIPSPAELKRRLVLGVGESVLSKYSVAFEELSKR